MATEGPLVHGYRRSNLFDVFYACWLIGKGILILSTITNRQYESLWDFVIEGIVDFFVGGSIVQGVLSHFCPNKGEEGRRFTQEAHHIHVGGWIEFHETHVEGKFNIVSVHAHGFGGLGFDASLLIVGECCKGGIVAFDVCCCVSDGRINFVSPTSIRGL